MKDKLRCFHCNKEGHFAPECPKRLCEAVGEVSSEDKDAREAEEVKEILNLEN